MKRILRVISGKEHTSLVERNKMFLNVYFKAYDDTFEDAAHCGINKKNNQR